MKGTTCEWRTGPLAPTKPSSRVILVMMVRGVSASQQRSLWDGDREHRGTRAGQVEEGNGVRGLVAGLSWGTSGGFVERRGSGLRGKASRGGVDCGGIRSGGGGRGGRGRGRGRWKR